MNAQLAHLRGKPRVQRQRAPVFVGVDPATVRRSWLDLVADAQRMAERLIATVGEESIEADDLRAAATRMTAGSFPVPYASARSAAKGFLALLEALIEAAQPRNRALLAPAVLASARALDLLMNDQAVAAAQATWARGD